MPKFYVSEAHLGSEATQAQAEQVIAILQGEGFDVEYGESQNDATEDEKLEFEGAFYRALDQIV